MGAIQNSINSVLGTATVLAAGGKKLKSDADAMEAARTQEITTISKEMPSLDEEIEAQGKTVVSAIEDFSNISQKYEPELERIAEARKRGFESEEQAYQADIRGEEIGLEIQKREKALTRAQDKLAAMEMQKKIYAERLAKLKGGKK